MERRKSEKMSDALMRFMRLSGLETPLNEYRLLEAWAEVAGPMAAKYSEARFIRNQTLHVHVSSAALRTELVMRRTQLVQQLNRAVGAQVIADVVFQ